MLQTSIEIYFSKECMEKVYRGVGEGGVGGSYIPVCNFLFTCEVSIERALAVEEYGVLTEF